MNIANYSRTFPANYYHKTKKIFEKNHNFQNNRIAERIKLPAIIIINRYKWNAMINI